MARSTSMTRDEILANPTAAQAALDDVAKEPKSPLPVAEYPPDDLVTLPGGLMYKGELLRTVVVRELTGEHEEALAQAIQNPNPYHFLDTLLTCGVDQLGSLTHEDSASCCPTCWSATATRSCWASGRPPTARPSRCSTGSACSAAKTSTRWSSACGKTSSASPEGPGQRVGLRAGAAQGR